VTPYGQSYGHLISCTQSAFFLHEVFGRPGSKLRTLNLLFSYFSVIQWRIKVAKTKTELREWISSGFTRVEDIAYIALGIILAVSAMGLLGTLVLALGQALLAANLSEKIVELLDQVLLILMIVEILYTVQVSFREHTLVAEPFLIVGLIAAIRRVLILTAEFSKPAEVVEATFRNAMFELGLLTVLILALVFSLFLVKRQHIASAERA
jgi:uncharacterized membrane protein (DUF373 family)